MPITKFDPNACRLLRAELEAALKIVADKHGISIKTGKMTYSDTNVKVSLEVATVSEGGEVNTREKKDFLQFAEIYGLKPTDLGRNFKSQGELYQITGLNTKKQKFAIQAKRLRDGHSYGFVAEDVKRALI
jgi:hypothetical protein